MTQFLWHPSVTQLFSPGAMQVIGAPCGSVYSSLLDWQRRPVLWKQELLRHLATSLDCHTIRRFHYKGFYFFVKAESSDFS